jgi:hypothetical protein
MKTGNIQIFFFLKATRTAVFSFDVDAEDDDDKLVYRDTLTNIEEVSLDDYDYGYYYYYWSFINRGIRIGDYIYTISDEYINSYSLTTLEQIASIDLYLLAE